VLADKRLASSFLKNSGKSARNKKAELNHDGSCVNDLGLRSVSDVHAAIKAGLAGAETAKRIIMTVNRECFMLCSSSFVSNVAPLYATGNRSSYHGCFFTSSWNPGKVGIAASYKL
jgi:hypothetical protein